MAQSIPRDQVAPGFSRPQLDSIAKYLRLFGNYISTVKID